ncbi:MAG: hypothetical protein Q8J89_01280 [Caulobacter sp.]|nr:hypothetical protein [Caulobacter sp.]
MSIVRKAVYMLVCLASLALVIAMMATTARAQSDPFGSLYAPPPGSGPAPSTRTGVTGVTGAVGRSYVGSQEAGFASLGQIGMLPRVVPALPLRLKPWNPKVSTKRPRILVPTYALALVRTGKISAFGGGAGSQMAGRRTTITTALVGVDEDLPEQLAEEAYQDLLSRLTAAGFEVVSPEEIAASPEVGRLQLVGQRTKGVNGMSVYGPRSAPLRTGHPYTNTTLSSSRSAMVFSDMSAELDALVLTPQLALDYQWLEGTGQRTYVGSAQVEAKVWFNVLSGSGAHFVYGQRKGLGSGPYGGFLMDGHHGSAEPFGIMYEVDDRSDSVALSNAFATAGLGSLYRQSQIYAVEVSPDRYAALVRAAFQGLNMSIVAELKKARGL